MRPRPNGDAGQAFPIYITVVGGLLFLAFAYFAVGQAAANRNGAQTAADAAALAAAQDTRDQIAGEWVKNVLDPTKWQDIFDGNVTGIGPSCWRAHQLAAQNDARVISCAPEGLLGFTVEVETNKPVGNSVVPGTEERKANASATAVIEPRCAFKLPAEDAGDDVLPRLSCKDRDWDLNPDDLTDLPKPADLFDVHLAD
ncbi:pilus assembly protein TadG-related protein [Streptomyces sp. S.PNR 29]|uniref:pilus assembly protein TadG-related protein n=1 Tax=Streptomyces sp. S.PNR 29 TaxID=2973805 RepID=UPI0025B01D52|nr:pilus assembly protein TadG-related protein [Streptomyces sp. S.PNR 29]MDN0195456.1 pilus assembly protein TadG-related protein [Streptomyces sp. S.PNR 29]